VFTNFGVLEILQYDFANHQYGNSLLANGEAAAGDDEDKLQKSLDVANECTVNGKYEK
jgi:hypothetical protein